LRSPINPDLRRVLRSDCVGSGCDLDIKSDLQVGVGRRVGRVAGRLTVQGVLGNIGVLSYVETLVLTEPIDIGLEPSAG
jgi:hypothetical protein